MCLHIFAKFEQLIINKSCSKFFLLWWWDEMCDIVVVAAQNGLESVLKAVCIGPSGTSGLGSKQSSEKGSSAQSWVGNDNISNITWRAFRAADYTDNILKQKEKKHQSVSSKVSLNIILVQNQRPSSLALFASCYQLLCKMCVCVCVCVCV